MISIIVAPPLVYLWNQPYDTHQFASVNDHQNNKHMLSGNVLSLYSIWLLIPNDRKWQSSKSLDLLGGHEPETRSETSLKFVHCQSPQNRDQLLALRPTEKKTTTLTPKQIKGNFMAIKQMFNPKHIAIMMTMRFVMYFYLDCILY